MPNSFPDLLLSLKPYFPSTFCWLHSRVQNRGSSLPSPQSLALLQYLLSGTQRPLEQLYSAREQPVGEEAEPGAICKLAVLPGPKELDGEPAVAPAPAPDPDPAPAPPPPPPPPEPAAAAAVAARPKLRPRQRSSVSVEVVAGSGCRRC